jgi:TRAP-type C4-dicarboxylate transport system substrate-binding protein
MSAKKLLILGLALFFAAAATFLPHAAHAKKPKWEWKTGTLAPKGVGYANQVRDILLPAIEGATDGDVVLKVYWGGVMGDDEQHIQKMRMGQLHAAGLSGQGTFLMAGDMAVLGLPFLFESWEEVDYLKERMMDRFDAIVAKHGFKLLLWLDQDFDQIYSTREPIAGPDDFARARFVTWFGPLEGRLLQRFGTNPVPMGVAEIPSGLRSGVSDSMIAPSIWIVGTQLYSTFRFVNPMKIRYVPAFCVSTVAAWDALPEAYQNNIRRDRLEWSNRFTKDSRVEGDKCLAAMIRYGVKEISSTPEQMEQVKAQALPIWGELAGKLYPAELLEEIKAHLADYRAGR